MASEAAYSGIQKILEPRLGKARTDRAQIESYIDDCYRQGIPGRRFMTMKGGHNDQSRQHDIFDSELQFEMREASAELKSIYTPHQRDWGKLAPTKQLPRRIAENRQLKELLHSEQSKLFEAMRATRLDQALDTGWEDWLISAGGIEIMAPRRGGRAVCQAWPANEMLIEACAELPQGIDGRWRVQKKQKRYLKMALPMVDWDEYLKRERKLTAKDSDTFNITFGYRYDADNYPDERWFFEVMCNDKVVHHELKQGPGCVGLIPFRSGENSPSPWGYGPAAIALSPARALDQIAYLMLKVLPKRVDPPFWHTADGIFNVDNGLIAGDAIPAGPEFQIGMIESRHGMDELFTEVETLRTHVKRALWQDRPAAYEPGTTPPTAFQIQQQELQRSIRQERPRARINPELVIPVMQRFIRIESEANRMSPIRLEGIDAASPIVVEPKSPLSRAADLEAVQQAQMLLQMVAGFMGDQGLMSLDMSRTIENIRDRLGEGALMVQTQDPEVAAQQRAMSEAAAAGGQAAGAAGGEAVGAQLGAT